MNDVINIFAESSDVGERIDILISRECGITRSAAQKLLEGGDVSVNGKAAKKNHKVAFGDEINVLIPQPEMLDVVPQNIPIDIVYEDEHLLVVNKPKGMVVHPAPGNPDKTLVNALMYHCKDSLSSINGVIRPGIVHRIDKDTSGLLIVAKTDAAHIGLAEQIKEHSFTRIYNAIVTGGFKSDNGTVDAPIGRNPSDRKKMAVIHSESSRNAITHYKVLERLEGYTYLELKLETGRTHQIRVHMASLGHPVIGDPLYKSNFDKFERVNSELLAGQCLHARIIGFTHPITGKALYFDSGLPEYFTKILEKLRDI